MAPLAWLIAHGGTSGAIAEASVGLFVAGVVITAWLRERSARRADEDGASDEGH